MLHPNEHATYSEAACKQASFRKHLHSIIRKNKTGSAGSSQKDKQGVRGRRRRKRMVGLRLSSNNDETIIKNISLRLLTTE